MHFLVILWCISNRHVTAVLKVTVMGCQELSKILPQPQLKEPDILDFQQVFLPLLSRPSRPQLKFQIFYGIFLEHSMEKISDMTNFGKTHQQ